MHGSFKLAMMVLLFHAYSAFNISINAQELNQIIEPNIDITSKVEVTEISFSAYNKSEIFKSLKYKYLVAKKYKNNTIESENLEDSNYFIIESGERKNIATIEVRIEPMQRVIVLLLIYDEDKIISKKRVVINKIKVDDNIQPIVVRDTLLKAKKNSKPNQNSDINLLSGLVIENTKTKPGRDFYKEFYSAYKANNINGNKVVKVDEALAIGGNTQIKIYAGDDLVVQFIINPRGSYLKEMAEQSVLMVYRYFQQKNNINQNLIRF